MEKQLRIENFTEKNVNNSNTSRILKKFYVIFFAWINFGNTCASFGYIVFWYLVYFRCKQQNYFLKLYLRKQHLWRKDFRSVAKNFVPIMNNNKNPIVYLINYFHFLFSFSWNLLVWISELKQTKSNQYKTPLSNIIPASQQTNYKTPLSAHLSNRKLHVSTAKDILQLTVHLEVEYPCIDKYRIELTSTIN